MNIQQIPTTTNTGLQRKILLRKEENYPCCIILKNSPYVELCSFDVLSAALLLIFLIWEIPYLCYYKTASPLSRMTTIN